MISIIMGLYNAQSTIVEAIDSIVNQTYKDWELIICDDGSSDNGALLVEEYSKKDQRIKLIRNDRNRGLNYTLNHCLEYVSGEYVARMDADDISLPTRLEEELDLLVKSSVDFVSCSMIFFDEKGDWGEGKVIPEPQKSDFIYGTPFCHAPCLVKTSAYKAVDGYTVDDKLLRVEDYHLWYKMYKKGFTGVNLEKSLYKMRDDRNASNRRKFKYRINEAYVKYLIWRDFKYPLTSCIHILRPILVGLLPQFVYDYLHHRRLRKG